MSLTAAALRKMAELGLTLEQAAELAEMIEPTRTARQERNARYYAKRLNKTPEQDAPSPEQKVSPTPPSKTQTSPPPSPPMGAHGSTDYPPNAFEVWYSGYPHKVGRGAAERAFDAARRAHRPTFAELIAGRDRYIRSKPPDRPWCNPATWLNQQRWLDEPETTPTLRVINGQSSNNSSGYRGDGRKSGAETQLESIARQIALRERDGGG